MKISFLLLFFLANQCLAQIIIYDGYSLLRNNVPATNNLDLALLLAELPERDYQQKVVISNGKQAYAFSRPTVGKGSPSTEGDYIWTNYADNSSYSHRTKQVDIYAKDLTKTNETKEICGYKCQMYYSTFTLKSRVDTIYHWISPKLPNKISPFNAFVNQNGIKGAVLAEKSRFGYWEAISVKKCDKIDKKLFDWSLHPNNVNSEQLKKYVPCSF